MQQVLVLRTTDAGNGPDPSATPISPSFTGIQPQLVMTGVGYDDQADRVMIAIHEGDGPPRHEGGADGAFAGHGVLISDTGDRREAPAFLFMIGFQVPDAELEDFDAWYMQDHIPLLLKADGWLRVRRYEMLPGARWNRFALHEIRDVQTWEGPEKIATRSTPWRQRLAATHWYQAHERGFFRVTQWHVGS